jgi:hypothetical protein
MNGAALAIVASGSAVQVGLYLRDFGATHRTDGLIAAFAVYTLVVVLGQLLRTTAVPLLSGRQPALAGPTFAWAIAGIAVLAAVVCAAVSSPLAHLVANASGPVGRRTAATSLLIMAPAIGLQLSAAGIAVGGAIRGRLDAVAMAYMASAAAGVIAFFALRGAAAEKVLAWTMLIASIVLVAGLVLGVRIVPRRPPTAPRVAAAMVALAASVPLPASFLFMYPLTLALAPRGRPGQITLFGLAFTACSYLAGFTGQALSMSDAVTLSRLDRSAVAARQAMVIRAFRYSLLLAAPGLGIAAVAGGPVVRALLPADSTGANSFFGVDVVLLIPWLVATLGVWATLPVVLSDADRLTGRRLAAAVIGLMVIHVAATLAGRALAGFDGVVVAMAVAPAAFVVVGLRAAGPGTGMRLLRLVAIVGAVAALSFGLLELISRSVAAAGPVTGIFTALAGALVYVGLAAMADRDAARTVARLVGRR